MVHVIARGDAGSSLFTAIKGVSCVLGEPAFIDQADGIEHGAAVLIEEHVFADSFANDLQADPLRFKRCGLGR